jgi:hypothetical protein
MAELRRAKDRVLPALGEHAIRRSIGMKTLVFLSWV